MRFCKAVLCALLVMPCLAHAQLTTMYAQRSILGTLTNADATALGDAAKNILTSAPDGKQTVWTAPRKTRSNTGLEATFLPVETRTDAGQRCRLLQTTLRRGEESEQWKFWFCQQKDGRWRSRAIGDK
jgi:surface antigen